LVELKQTILFREGGSWSRLEVSRLTRGLQTEVSGMDSKPEYLVLLGHYSKEEVLRAMMGGESFVVTQVTDARDSRLPWQLTPCFCMRRNAT